MKTDRLEDFLLVFSLGSLVHASLSGGGVTSLPANSEVEGSSPGFPPPPHPGHGCFVLICLFGNVGGSHQSTIITKTNTTTST
jgi:hypothetical protein